MRDRKPPEKKPPESKKNRKDEFPENPPEMFRIFWLRWFQNPLLEPSEKKRGKSSQKYLCLTENHQKKTRIQSKKESKR